MALPHRLLATALLVALTLSWSAPASPFRANSPPAPGPEAVFVLYGSASQGWGFSASTLTNPGPLLSANLSETVTMILVSADGSSHQWFLDYNNNSVVDSGEPVSSVFNGTQAMNLTFQATQAGVFTYRCAFHPATMRGTFEVTTSDVTPPTINVAVLPSPSVGQTIYLTATIADASGVQSATLFYAVGDGAPLSTPMVAVGSDSYRGTIPAQSSPVTITFYVVATDNAGNSARYPASGTYAFTVAPAGVLPAPTAGLGAGLLILLVAVLVVGVVFVVAAARSIGRRPPGTAP